LVAAEREGPDAFYPADTPQTAKPSTTLIWEGPVKPVIATTSRLHIAS
jgi:hypothetical protein